MASVITFPNIFDKFGNGPSIYIAGDFSQYDWQEDAIKWLDPLPVTLLNPRQNTLPISSTEDYIKWEYNHLQKSTQVMFWFNKESDCSDVLFQLGVELYRPKTLWIGCDSQYKLKDNITIQTKLVRPRQKIYNDLNQMCLDMVDMIKK